MRVARPLLHGINRDHLLARKPTTVGSSIVEVRMSVVERGGLRYCRCILSGCRRVGLASFSARWLRRCIHFVVFLRRRFASTYGREEAILRQRLVRRATSVRHRTTSADGLELDAVSVGELACVWVLCDIFRDILIHEPKEHVRRFDSASSVFLLNKPVLLLLGLSDRLSGDPLEMIAVVAARIYGTITIFDQGLCGLDPTEFVLSRLGANRVELLAIVACHGPDSILRKNVFECDGT